jgi:hypothetical protein
MKLGPLEIVVILIIVGVFLIVFRGMPRKKVTTAYAPPPAPPRARRPTAEELEEERIKTSRRNRLRWLGGVFVFLGVFLLAAAFKGFSYIVMMSTGAGLILVLGIIVLFLSVRR